MVAPNGRCMNQFGIAPARCSGRLPMSAGWSAIPISSTRRCCMAARRSCSRASPVGTPDAGTSGESSPSTAWWPSSTASDRLFSAIKGRTRRGEFVGKYDLSKFRHLFLGGRAGARPETTAGPRTRLKVPVIDHWWQTEDRRARSSTSCRPRHAAGFFLSGTAPGRARAGLRHWRSLDDAGHEVPPGQLRQRRHPPAAAARPACPICWNADERFAPPISRISRLRFNKTLDAGYTRTTTAYPFHPWAARNSD